MKMKVDILPFVEELEGEVVNGHLSNAQKCFSDVLDKAHRCCHFKFFLTANVFFCWCLLIHSALVFPPTCHTMFNENRVVSPPSVSAACNSNVTPRNWTRLPRPTILVAVRFNTWLSPFQTHQLLLCRYTSWVWWAAAYSHNMHHPLQLPQRICTGCTTHSDYFSVYAHTLPLLQRICTHLTYVHSLPTDAGELAWPARSWYHTPACQRGRSSLQAFPTFFFNRLSADIIC